VAALGTYLRISDLDAIMTLEEMCNEASFDTISAGATIAFAMECYERDLLTEDELDGLTLEWGHGESAIALLQRMIERRGLGDVLADGVLRASRRIGRGSEAFAIHAGGQELPAHDPRHTRGFGLVYRVSPTPGRHTQGGPGAGNMSAETRALYGLDPDLANEDPLRAYVESYAAHSAWVNALNAAGLCLSGSVGMGPEHVPNFLSAVTGWSFDMAECLEVGERIEVMRHLFGLREGYNPLETQVTPRAMGRPPQETGPTAGTVVDMDEELSAYLTYRDWDPESGRPSEARLTALGLSSLVAAR
jgi:aldehyde:ferredoxin oxidoreductase